MFVVGVSVLCRAMGDNCVLHAWVRVWAVVFWAGDMDWVKAAIAVIFGVAVGTST